MVSKLAVAFLLQGRVQKVKMRRYIESAARHFGVGGYVINTPDGRVFGEAWVMEDGDNSNDHLMRNFSRWIRGEWEPPVFSNEKPTPIGTAYPEKARVETCVFLGEGVRDVGQDRQILMTEFVMVRDDQTAEMMARERRHILELLLHQKANNRLDDDEDQPRRENITISAWPKR
jgi:acylphosphatase